MSGFNMDDYVPVNERLEAFYKKFPKGSIQSEIVELTESRVTVKAYAYREPEDPRPGTGLSSLNIPGSTTFTRGSEIENAETSAWGRAIAALGFEVKRGIASHEEVRNKTPQRDGQSAAASRPVAGGAKAASPQPSPAPDDDPYADAPPMFDSDPDLLVAQVERVTGGREIPTDLTERIERAAAKGQPKESECPVHHKAKQNKRGLYCPTNMGTRDEPLWCDWQVAA